MHKIYLLFILVLLSSGLFSQTLIAGWDFQTTANGGTATAAATSTPTLYNANVGTGTMYLNGTNGSSSWSQSTELDAFAGTTLNAGGTTGLSTATTSPAALAPLGGSSNSANGKFITFRFSMASYKDLVVSYATQRTGTGFTAQTWEYSINGNTWLTATTVSSITTSFTVKTLSTITGLDNVATAYLRLSLTGATAAIGNNRVDNIQLNATAIPSLPMKLAITTISPASPVVNNAFSVTVQSQDANSNASGVSAATDFSLSVNTGTGMLGGTITGTIVTGSSQATVSGVIYNTAESGIVLTATRTAGDMLTAGNSAAFTVLGVATKLAFIGFPATGTVNNSVASFTVEARRADNTVDGNFTGNITLSKSTGTGNLTGTLTKAAVAGVATFNDINFDAAGSYTLSAASSGLTSATSSSITISAAPVQPTMTELVVPQYIASKTSTSSNSSRVPFAFCLSFDNLLANTTYKLSVGLALSGDAATSYGAGSIASGNSFSGVQALNNAFTTNASGGSGPVWIQYEATANDSRFGGGQVHYLRASVYTGSAPNTPQFIGTKTITALDIASTPTVATSDDGAFLKGQTSTAFSGKYILTYDNESASGNPLSVYQVRTATATSTANNTSSLPIAIADVVTQTGTSAVGDFAVIFPIGTNNSNGLRRVEIRNADNTVFNAFTTSNGVWNTTNNTTTIARREVQTINLLAGSVNNLVVNNTYALTGALTINGNISLNNGYITTTSANSLRLTANATVSGGSNTSFIDGPVTGATNSTAAKLLPVGKSSVYKPVTITPTTTDASEYTAEYFAATTPSAPLESRLTAYQTNEYWQVDRTSGTAPATVTLNYNSTGATWSNGMNPNVSDVISIVHLRNGNNTWTQEYGTYVPNNTTTATLTTGTITDFSPFTFGYGPSVALPVTLTSFTAAKTASGNVLNWKVSGEINFSQYVVERSTSGNGGFTPIATITANNSGNYTATDAQPGSYNYYRLKLVDKDGKVSYSKTILIINQAKGFAITNVYPTVTAGMVILESYAAAPIKVTIRVINQVGQPVYHQSVTLNQSNLTNVNLGRFANGNYLLQIQAEGYSKTVKLVKQ